ncbi:hypothetical protein [Caulobacter sp. BK020]|uniref:hypothetical protein n=1 Tax=Caulobacter sp. BK020 TaxID=2512117 RepID=UPI00104E3D79|nr:hypothetical protein [Caulobacter sp. BK020]
MIVVHLDGDIAVECADQFGGALPVPPSVEDRVAFLSSKLKNWVDPDSNYEKQIKFAVPTQKTESWMLAGISDNAHNWEEIESKSVLLLETGFVQGPGRAQHYRDVAVKLLGMSEKIAARCRSFQLFRDQFSQ